MIDVDEVYRVPASMGQKSSSSRTATTIDSSNLAADIRNVSLGEEDNEKENDPSGANRRRPVRTTTRDQENNVEEEEEEINLYKSGKYNLFQRHANQLLIRGDNVVFVTLSDWTQTQYLFKKINQNSVRRSFSLI